jgi:hypothetical protein
MTSTDTTDSLEQGKLCQSNKKKICKGDKLCLSEQIECYKPHVEGFLGSATQIPLDRDLSGRPSSPVAQPPPMLKLNIDTSKIHNSDLQKLEDKFNVILAKYTKIYKLMSEELLLNNNQTVMQKYANNNVKLNNNYYYVNSYGFASKYDQDAWENRSVSCSRDPIEISSEDFKKLLVGPPMGNGQACNVAGFNINGQDGWLGWVDIKGVAHHYPNMDIWTNRNQSCISTPISLEDTEVQAMPKGNDMMKDTFCQRLNVNPQLLQNLALYNNQMIDLGNQILAETNKLSVTDKHLNEQLNIAKKNLDVTLKKLKPTGVTADPFSNDTYFGNGTANVNRTLEAAARNSQIVLQMNYLKYVIAAIVVVILVILTFTTFSAKRVSTLSMIIVGIALVILAWNFLKRFF